MFFAKPDVRYVDMCIYIDEHIYEDDCDHALAYEYLFHIIHMLTIKRGYFKRTCDNEDFSLYAASQYYMRLTDKRQFEEPQTLEPVRSILNYVRKTLFSYRNEYAKKHLMDDSILADVDIVSIDLDYFKCFVSNEIDPISRADFVGCMQDVKSVAKEVLSHTPYKKNTPEWCNIYISCMLSFLNSITLRNRDIKRLNSFKRSTTLTNKLINDLYLKERYNSVILYHLDDSMENYIAVLTNRIRHEVSKELSKSLRSSHPACVTMKNLLMSGVSYTGEQNEY